MNIDITQVWEYEFKPTDTMRLLHAFKSHWELAGDEITLENRGGRMFAVRREGCKCPACNGEYKCPEIEAFGREIFEGFPSIRGNND